MVNGLRGAIIAAGRGERLRGAVDDLPKPLIELGGEPMLVRQARMLQQAGAETVVALVNSETAGLIAARAVRIPPWMKLQARDTPSSMESLFTLGERPELAAQAQPRGAIGLSPSLESVSRHGVVTPSKPGGVAPKKAAVTPPGPTGPIGAARPAKYPTQKPRSPTSMNACRLSSVK